MLEALIVAQDQAEQQRSKKGQDPRMRHKAQWDEGAEVEVGLSGWKRLQGI